MSASSRLQRRALQRRARDAAVVVAVGHQHPAFRLLAGDVGFAGLALRIERVELLLQTFLARLAGVDRAAEFSDDRLFHGRASPVLEAEEEQPVPARAGDGACDRRKRFVRPALIFEILVAHRDAVLDALVFADQPRAGDRPLVRWLPAPRRVTAVEFFAELPQALQRLGLEATVGQFLDPIGEPVLQEAPVVGWRLTVEEFAPFAPSTRRSARSSRRPIGPARYRSLQASVIEGVGMTALVGGTVERTLSGRR